MPVTMTLKKDIPYVEQKNQFYCGPASTLMVLNFLNTLVIGANSNKTEQDILDESRGEQFGDDEDDILDEDTKKAWEKWRTTPQQIVNMIHSTGGNDINLWMNYFASGSYFFIDRLRAITQDESENPPAIVPVHDGYHWVVLSQYAENLGYDEKGNILKYGSFCGRDPLYYESESIDFVDGSSSYLGFINIAETPLNFEKKANQVLIGPSSDPGNIMNTVTSRPGNINASRISLPGTPVPIADAQRLVMQKLKDFGVTTPCLAGRHLDGAVPGPAFRVRRIDRTDSTRDYYLVGMQNQTTKENRMLVRMDIGTGLYLDSLCIRPTTYLLDKPRYNVALIERVKKRIGFYQQNAPKTKQRWIDAFLRVLTNPETTLVWCPCEESPSAFYPFFEIKESSKSKILFYVRIDGQIFEHLTPEPRPLT